MQRGLELVRHQGEKLVFHPVRRFRLVARFVELAGLIGHHEVGGDERTDDRQLTQVLLRVRAGGPIGNADEEDADRLVIGDERNGGCATVSRAP